ncbi:uncharacterized protein G2W53_039990 [Senna tora]|uniref:Uncharacterized protein n=1 Tax=Senna tora TaxID=362788 RepID=A0A834W8F7_9FABA|nr:uncharacterized protein G2W53_039990 [Senna tora]
MTQGNLARSFKAIRLARVQIFDGRRLGSPSVAVHLKSITHGSTFFKAKSQVHMLSQKDPYDTKKPSKKF